MLSWAVVDVAGDLPDRRKTYEDTGHASALKVCICTQLLTVSTSEPPPNALLAPHHSSKSTFYVPITTASSSVKSYGGISKFNGAGPFLARPEIS